MAGLTSLGWNEGWAKAWADTAVADGAVPARVILEHGRFLRLHDGAGELLAVSAGRLRHEADTGAALPTVGDWVAVSKGTDAANGEPLGTIRAVLPRKSRFSRRRAGVRAVEQVVAANIDTVFLLMGLDADFNPRRLERYLSVTFASGARPIVVLNKADVAGDPDTLAGRVAAVAAIAGVAIPVLPTSTRTEDGLAAVMPHLRPGQTVALLGSSGVGKSSLLNRLAGNDLQRIADVRAHDGRGKHTTTYAQLFALPSGALVIDTPGLRELQLWEADEGVETAFSDIEEVAAQCRFRDCRHAAEPGCDVRAALADGRLSASRFASFQKLQAELGASRGRGAGPKGRRRS
ncbi:MAG TPA: ribosome small subunit-dependent GTPase A [Polyangia bacterium]